jgi:hypothetical protein
MGNGRGIGIQNIKLALLMLIKGNGIFGRIPSIGRKICR